MTTLPDEMLRPLVAEAVRAALGDVRRGAAADGAHAAPAAPSTPAQQPAPVPGRTVEQVRLGDDRELNAFVRRIVSLSANPRTRQQLVSGQLRFALDRTGPTRTSSTHVPGAHTAGARTAGAHTAGAHRVERGAVTERTVLAVAERGQDLLLGRQAVLTPLARDRARALGVRFEKES